MDRSQIRTALGSEFYDGPVVDLIVANLPLENKFHLLHQIKKEEKKRPPGSTSPMSGWKDSIERAFNKQRNICDEFNYDEISRKFGHINGEQCVIPAEWLKTKQLEKFKQLLILCPNLTGIHVIDRDRKCQEIDHNCYQFHCGRESHEFVNKRIFDVILTRAANLTSLTFRVKLKPRIEELMEFLRKRKGQMEYVNVKGLKLNHTKELIEINPNLRIISGHDLRMDFHLKELSIGDDVFGSLYPNGRILDFCSHFQRFNSIYKKSSANGIRLRKYKLDSCIFSENFQELVTSLTELEYLSMECEVDEVDVGRLKTLTNMRKLKIKLLGEIEDESEYFGQLLSHFSKLEELKLKDVFINEETLRIFHVICPDLKRLSICHDISYSLAKETLKEVAKLPELEYFEYNSWGNWHLWKDKEDVEANRRILNSEEM